MKKNTGENKLLASTSYFVSGPNASATVHRLDDAEPVISILCWLTGDSRDEYTATEINKHNPGIKHRSVGEVVTYRWYDTESGSVGERQRQEVKWHGTPPKSGTELYTHPAPAPATHPDDLAVDRFAAAMKEKLAAARAKGRGGWDDKEDLECHLSNLLRAHVEKGDPRDVANFCCFLWNRGESIQPAPARVPSLKFTLTEARKLLEFFGGHDAEATVELHPDRIDNDRMHFSGLYAYVTDAPEEGCEYLGPVEVHDESEAVATAPARVTEEMVRRAIEAWNTKIDDELAMRAALTAALEDGRHD